MHYSVGCCCMHTIISLHVMYFSLKNQQTTNCQTELSCFLTHHHQYQSPPSTPAPSYSPLTTVPPPQHSLQVNKCLSSSCSASTLLVIYLIPNSYFHKMLKETYQLPAPLSLMIVTKKVYIRFSFLT